MNAEIFSYLSQKILKEFDSCDWSDDKSVIYVTRYLGDMEEALKDMIAIEEQVQQLVKEVHSEIKYF